MDKTIRLVLIVGLAGIALVFGAGYALGFKSAPRELLDTEVKQSGFFGTETRRVLQQTVTSMKAENQLIVFRFAGEARVSVERTELKGLLRGSQELLVPATVTYFLDMKDLGEEDVIFDPRSKTVLVKLPRLRVGDVAFQPEYARQTNSGLMTLSADFVRQLERTNYSQARVAFVKSAQQEPVVGLAKQEAAKIVKTYFEIPLRVVGDTDIHVRAYFPDDR